MMDAGEVLGIDVGWSARRRSSAACLLRWDRDGVAWRLARFRSAEPERTDTLVTLAGMRSLAVVAIDGPLAPGFGAIDRYRSCERLLTRRLWRTVGKPGQSNTPVGRMLNAHADACAIIARDRLTVAPARHPEAIDAHAIVETFPTAFLGMLIGEPGQLDAVRANRSDRFFIEAAAKGGFTRLLAALLPGRVLTADPAAITDHDERAAFACALAALGVAVGRYAAAGDAADGWIILPPWRLIDPAARTMLLRNASEDANGVVTHHG